jgi:hypothetical protein
MAKGADESLGDIGFRHKGHFELKLACRIRGGLADGRDVQGLREKVNLESGGSFAEGSNCISTGENEPVVAVEMPQSVIEWFKAGWRLYFDYRNFDGLGTKSAKAFTEFAGLMCSACHEYASARQRLGH